LLLISPECQLKKSSQSFDAAAAFQQPFEKEFVEGEIRLSFISSQLREVISENSNYIQRFYSSLIHFSVTFNFGNKKSELRSVAAVGAKYLLVIYA